MSTDRVRYLGWSGSFSQLWTMIVRWLVSSKEGGWMIDVIIIYQMS